MSDISQLWESMAKVEHFQVDMQGQLVELDKRAGATAQRLAAARDEIHAKLTKGVRGFVELRNRCTVVESETMALANNKVSRVGEYDKLGKRIDALESACAPAGLKAWVRLVDEKLETLETKIEGSSKTFYHDAKYWENSCDERGRDLDQANKEYARLHDKHTLVNEELANLREQLKRIPMYETNLACIEELNVVIEEKNAQIAKMESVMKENAVERHSLEQELDHKKHRVVDMGDRRVILEAENKKLRTAVEAMIAALELI